MPKRVLRVHQDLGTKWLGGAFVFNSARGRVLSVYMKSQKKNPKMRKVAKKADLIGYRYSFQLSHSYISASVTPNNDNTITTLSALPVRQA